MTSSMRVTSSVEVKTVIPIPTWEGRLGMARITRASGSQPWSWARVVPAAMLITHLPWSAARSGPSSSTVGKRWGTVGGNNLFEDY